jgi:hypothetical protein
MRKLAVVFILSVAVLAAIGCKGATTPEVESFVGTWSATKAEYESVANPGTKVDIITQGSTLTLVFTANTCVLTITDPGEAPFVANATWSASTDVLTFTWTSGLNGDTQFDYVLDVDELRLDGGHMPFEFTAGNPEEAILSLILAKQ